jgi:hypothetical protein
MSADPWDRPCECGHPMRGHRLDMEDPEDGVTPDCDQCGCMTFKPERGNNMGTGCPTVVTE